MKKRISLFVAAVILSAAPSIAQNTSFGIKGGLNVCSVSNLGSSSTTTGTVNSSSGSKIKLGAHLGIYAAIMFSDRIGFQPELLFSMKGYSFESSSTILGTNYSSLSKATLNYIDIPLQLKINFNESFGILAGPYLGFLAGAKSVTESTAGSITTTSTSTSTTGITKMDLGLALGLVIQQEGGLNFGLKYERGFTSIDENDTNEANVNSVFQLFIGFGF